MVFLERRRGCSRWVFGVLVATSLVGCPQLREDDFSAVDTPLPGGGGDAGRDGLDASAGDGATPGGGAALTGGDGAAAVTGGVEATGGAVTGGITTGGAVTGGVEATGGYITTGGTEAGAGSETGGAVGVGGGGGGDAASATGGAAGGTLAPASGGAGGGAGAGGEPGSAGSRAGSAGEDAGPSCGDAVAEVGEECDGADLRSLDCEARGYTGGTLGCNPDCHLDESGCMFGVLCDFEATGQTGTIFTGTTSGRTSAVRDHSCASGGSGPDLSVSWVAPATRCYQIEITSLNDIDTILGVYASCALEEELACDDNGVAGNDGDNQLSRLQLDAVAGTRYAILVDSFYASDTGTVNVVVTPCW